MLPNVRCSLSACPVVRCSGQLSRGRANIARCSRFVQRFASVCCVILLACGSSAVDAPIACADDPVALKVYIRDSISGTFAGSNTAVTAATNQGALTLRSTVGTDAAPFMIPGGPGTYSLLVRKDGYRDWSRTDIQVQGVTSGPCKGIPTTTEVTAQLMPIQ